MWVSGWDGEASCTETDPLQEEWGLEVWRNPWLAFIFSSTPQNIVFYLHHLRQVLTALGYLTLMLLVGFLIERRVR